MKTLVDLFNKNPNTKTIDLSNSLIRDSDDIFKRLENFKELDSVSFIL